jgi:hypothetical protein
MYEKMKERDLSLREDIESSKLQVPIPKDQELENPTTSTTYAEEVATSTNQKQSLR